MTLYDFKPRFQNWLRPSVEGLARRGATANQVTIAAAAGSIVLGVAVALAAPLRWPFFLLPVWMFVRMALNAIDGMLARDHGQKSRLGAYLNELSDVVSDAALLLPFAVLPPFGAISVAVVAVLAAVSEFAGALGPTVGASRRYDGPLGKSDRALVIGVLGFWTGIGGVLPDWLWLVPPLLAILLAVTIWNRVARGLAEAAARDLERVR